MQDDDNIIDVGEADEQETEIDLDAAPQEEQPEEKPEIEIAEAPGTTHAETEAKAIKYIKARWGNCKYQIVK